MTMAVVLLLLYLQLIAIITANNHRLFHGASDMGALPQQHHRHLLHYALTLSPTNDSTLCNNHNNGVLSKLRCWSYENNGLTENCYDDRVTIPPSQCLTLQAQVNSSHFREQLHSIFDASDNNSSIRRLVLAYPVDHYYIISREIDEFMTFRTWFSYEIETFPWMLSSATARNKALITVTIDRYPQPYENHLHWIHTVQYPDGLTCQRSALLIHRVAFIHPGWASVGGMVYSAQAEYPYAINIMYTSQNNSANYTTAFISSDDCPNLTNRWRCAFLRVSNCTVPMRLRTSCYGDDNCDTDRKLEDSEYFFAAFINGTYLPSEQWRNLTNPGAEPIERPFHNQPYNANQNNTKQYANVPKFPVILPSNHTGQLNMIEGRNDAACQVNNGSLRFNEMHLGDEEILYLEQFLYRQNSYYRSLVSHKLHDYLHNDAEGKIFASQRCVAVHIRRGDRLGVDIYPNMTKYCEEHPTNGQDFGCGQGELFATVTLDKILRVAEKMVDSEVRAIFVATDDDAFIEEQKRLMNLKAVKVKDKRSLRHSSEKDASITKWQIYHLPSPISAHITANNSSSSSENSVSNDLFAARRGTAAGVHFFTTTRLMRRCEAFIGHFGSGMSFQFYRSMCHRHNGLKAICPPSYDMRQGFGKEESRKS